MPFADDMNLQEIIAALDAALPDAAVVRPGGSLLMLVGLPGTGKSSITRALESDLSFVVISTDEMRQELRQRPTYTAAEMMLVYEVCYALIERRLQRGQRVVFDASNYLAARRRYVADLARRCGAPVTICYVQAAQQTIAERLRRRSEGSGGAGDLSDADWTVYKWMVETQEPVVADHLIVDTTDKPAAEQAAKLRAYWLKNEERAASDLNLQSLRWANRFNRSHR